MHNFYSIFRKSEETEIKEPVIKKDKKDLQAGEMYEVVDEITDPETEVIVNMARKKYEVRKMLEGGSVRTTLTIHSLI